MLFSCFKAKSANSKSRQLLLIGQVAMATAPHRSSRLASRSVASLESTHRQTTPLAGKPVKKLPLCLLFYPRIYRRCLSSVAAHRRLRPLCVDVAGPPAVPPVQSDKPKCERLLITEPLLAETGRP